MQWISESEKLPPVAQLVLLATPRQTGAFWDLWTAQLLIRHEDVHPRPIKPGGEWAPDFWWSTGRESSDVHLVTGNGWWTMLNEIPLPPGAEHRHERGFHFIAQPKLVWVANKRSSIPPQYAQKHDARLAPKDHRRHSDVDHA